MKKFSLEPFEKRIEGRGAMIEEERHLMEEARRDLDALRPQLDDAISAGNVKLYKELRENAEEIEQTIKRHEQFIVDIGGRDPVKRSEVVEAWDKYRADYNKALVKQREAFHKDFLTMCKSLAALAELQRAGVESYEESRRFIRYHYAPDDDREIKEPEVALLPNNLIRALTDKTGYKLPGMELLAAVDVSGLYHVQLMEQGAPLSFWYNVK